MNGPPQLPAVIKTHEEFMDEFLELSARIRELQGERDDCYRRVRALQKQYNLNFGESIEEHV